MKTAWRLWLRRPLVTSLVLSLAVHLAVILLVQSRPFSRADRTTTVISARLIEAPGPQPAVETLAASEPLPASLPVEAVPPVSAPAPQPKPPAPDSELPTLELGVDSHWYLAKQVDEQPQPIGKIEPVYPREAQRRGQGGTLKLRLKIDVLGRVREVEVVEANPPELFNAAALEAFGNARFTPAMKDGRPVRIEAYYRLDFTP